MIKRNMTTNVTLLEQRHQDEFSVSIEETDPIIRLVQTKQNVKSKQSRAASLSTE